MVQEQSDADVACKKPLEYTEGRPLTSLMTLRNFVDGGHEVPDARILVCVKSIGAKKKCMAANAWLRSKMIANKLPVDNKKGHVSELVNVGVFDHTAEGCLTLWGATLASVDPWKPSSTILLISNPRCRLDRYVSISLTAISHVDVNPCMNDADWLRAYAQRVGKRDHVNPPFPKGCKHKTGLDSSPASNLNVGSV